MTHTEIAVVGAGPYGLSIAAHLRKASVDYRIFGRPMSTWREHMPAGMLLKSDGFASNLSDPADEFTLQKFCLREDLEYHHTHIPVPLETFIDYGLAFQQRMVPDLDPRQVTDLRRCDAGFSLRLEDGEECTATRVVMAVGIMPFAYLPPELAAMPRDLVTHSGAHKDLSKLASGQTVIIGGGASAIDIAVLLREAGGDVRIITRRDELKYHAPPSSTGQTHWQRIRWVPTGIGPGWRSRFYTEAPAMFHRLPEKLRLNIVRSHLGPAAGWPMKARIGNTPVMPRSTVQHAEVFGSKVKLTVTNNSGAREAVVADHVIAATGYRVDLHRLKFLAPELTAHIRSAENTPILDRHFESSVPGLYFVGVTSANSFGPMMRFAFGADYTARRLAPRLARFSRRRSVASAPAVRPAKAAHPAVANQQSYAAK
jgi:thioredoxin reductase